MVVRPVAGSTLRVVPATRRSRSATACASPAATASAGAAGDALVDVPAYVEAALGDPSEAVSYGNLENVTTDTAAATDTDTVREGATR